ncbi:hypothetical protein [Peribacillus sp. CSMR9]|uniref:hypothetical protein n=1 Tax=Peribacillus sp. CSMR9 TaxID=2981350 RepID=UPI003989C25F
MVKGHSQTGETIKFDGRYFNLNFLDTYISSERETVVNLVTIDYIIQATLSLALYNELFVDELYKKDQKTIFQWD